MIAKTKPDNDGDNVTLGTKDGVPKTSAVVNGNASKVTPAGNDNSKKKTKMVCYLPDSLYNTLDNYSKMSGNSKSGIICSALFDYFQDKIQK